MCASFEHAKPTDNMHLLGANVGDTCRPAHDLAQLTERSYKKKYVKVGPGEGTASPQRRASQCDLLCPC